MDLVRYLLPVIVLYPVAINALAKFYGRLRLNPVLFVAPVLLLGLSFFSFAESAAIQLVFFKTDYFNLGLRLDVLSGFIASTVLTIGIVVIRFSVRYLEDDPKKELFSNHLACTLSCVLLMLMAPNLVLLTISWVGVSYFLHKLLTHFSDRKGAIKAARQKFWISRLGDVFIVGSGILLLKIFGSLEFQTIFEMIRDPFLVEKNGALINLASVLLVLGAMTKSAQFPFHFWLPNTMETPTPVSALMHAGIINAGGYLVVRVSPLLESSPISLSILALVGGFTAFWGFVVMLTQTNVKKSLAYSTISQMGFMMLQCGLGVFSVAVVHIIGHAFYKAYSFLSSGSATDFGRLNRYFPKKHLTQSLGVALVVALSAFVFVFSTFTLLGYHIEGHPGIVALLTILSLAAAQMILSSQDKVKSIAATLGILLVYLTLSKAMGFLLSDLVPIHFIDTGFIRALTATVCVALFVVLYFMQNGLHILSNTEFGKRIYVKALRESN